MTRLPNGYIVENKEENRSSPIFFMNVFVYRIKSAPRFWLINRDRKEKKRK